MPLSLRLYLSLRPCHAPVPYAWPYARHALASGRSSPVTPPQDFLTDTDFLASSLWPNNPSLHPPILYGLFKDWDGEAAYEAGSLPTLIYAEMRTDSAKALVQMDRELCSIVGKLAELYPHNAHLKRAPHAPQASPSAVCASIERCARLKRVTVSVM